MKPSLIASCGINCGICYAHLRQKNKCPGCRNLIGDKAVSIARCKIRSCTKIQSDGFRFCFECNDFPCKGLKNLDKRYRTKYKMSEIENLEYIKNNGIEKFIENEKIKWSCSECKGIINVHSSECSSCGKKR